MQRVLKIPLVLEAQDEGGYTVTSPTLPELVTEGDSLEEALEHVKDAVAAVIEIYEDRGIALPSSLVEDPDAPKIEFEGLVAQP